MPDLQHIRNFSIIAHIDHGKSTLADRLIQLTGTVAERDMKEQLLDAMDIERERGITIKANTVRIEYPAKDGHTYVLNLIDTPGHVDFAYEVSRSMRAVEGSLLVVDSTRPETLHSAIDLHAAVEQQLGAVPFNLLLNKIDLVRPKSKLLPMMHTVVEEWGMAEAFPVSARTGDGVDALARRLLELLPVAVKTLLGDMLAELVMLRNRGWQPMPLVQAKEQQSTLPQHLKEGTGSLLN